jgi:hypothetical protein
MWIMLNPSTADAVAPDHTITKCIGFAKRWGYNAIDVFNLFALRSTNPKGLLANVDPCGPLNDQVLRQAVHEATWKEEVPTPAILAWGAGSPIRKLLETRVRRFGRDFEDSFSRSLGLSRFQCLGTTLGGQPRHPLMLAYDTKLQPWIPGIPKSDPSIEWSNVFEARRRSRLERASEADLDLCERAFRADPERYKEIGVRAIRSADASVNPLQEEES